MHVLPYVPDSRKDTGSARYKIVQGSWAWWCIPIIPALGTLRQEGHKFEPCLKKKGNTRGMYFCYGI
jgi:hypothetical protein